MKTLGLASYHWRQSIQTSALLLQKLETAGFLCALEFSQTEQSHLKDQPYLIHFNASSCQLQSCYGTLFAVEELL